MIIIQWTGGEKLKDKRQTKHKQEGFQDKGQEETVEKRKRPLSEGAITAGGSTVWGREWAG
jgi:hypothetical protein